MLYLLIFVISLAASYSGVEFFRRWSLRRGFLDVPNDRSSHDQPTPRGGGLVIVVLTVVAYIVVCVFFPQFFAWSFLVGGILIAAISWLDDLYSVNVLIRFFFHSIAALTVIVEVGYFESVSLPFGFESLDLGVWGLAISFLWIVWIINAFNFMDGIDGIAGGQAVVSAVGWLMVALIVGDQPTALFGLAIAGSCLGFLFHNWQPAKIFMGDVGSAYVGFVISALPLLVARTGAIDHGILPWLALSMIWLFVFDTVFTFCRRLVGRERVWRAHRGHIYQRLTISGKSHSYVALVYIIVMICVALSALFILLLGPNYLTVHIAILTGSSGGLLLRCPHLRGIVH